MLARTCLLTLVLALATASGAQAACTKTWVLGAAAGTWSTGANWSGGTSPTATDDVCIPAGAGTVTFDPAAVSVRSLQLARQLQFNPATTLTITGSGATNSSELATGASVTGSGTLLYGAASTLNKTGAGEVQLNTELDFDGPVNVNAGTLTFTGGSDSVNAYAGAFTLAGGTTLSIGPNGFGTHTFDGTVTDGAGSAAVVNATGNVATFNGTYDVQTTTTTGNMTMNGASKTLGVLNLTAGTLAGNAAQTITQALNVSAGTLGGTGATTVAAAATLDFQTAGAKQVARTLINQSSTTTVLDVDGLSVNGAIDQRAGTTFRFADDHDLGGSGAFLTEAGTTVEKTGAGTSQITPDADFDGALDIDAGTLSLGIGSDSTDGNAGTVTLAGGTTFAIGTGGFGTHTFDGTVTDGAGSATVLNASGNLVTFNGTYDVQTTTTSGNLAFNGATTDLAVLNLNGGTLTGSASWSVSDTFTWTSGSLAGSGTTTIPSGATLDFQTAGGKSLVRTLNNDATAPVVLDVAGLFMNGVLDNRAGSTFRFADDQDIGGSGLFHVRSGATLEKLGTGTSTLVPDVNLDGAVDVDAGTFSLGIGSDTPDTNAGTITLAGGTTFAIGVGGFGTHAFSGTVTDGAGSATVTNASGNLVSFNGAYDVQTLTNSGNLAINGAATVPVLNLNGGTISGSADYPITQALNWAAGAIGGSGTITLAAGTTAGFTTAAAKPLQGSAVLRNETTTFEPPADGTLTVGGTARLDNAGTLTFTDDRDIAGSGEVRNLAGGTLQKTGGAGHSILPLASNAGTVNAAQGTLGSTASGVTGSGGTVTIQPGASFDPNGSFNQSGGTLRGGGTLEGDLVVNGGTVAPGLSAGVLTVTNGLNMGESGTLLIEVDGTAPGTGHDVLSVGGTAILDGTVAVDRDPGFNPANGDTFTFLTSADRIATFDAVTGGGLSGGRSLALDHPVSTETARLVVGLPSPPTAGTPAIAGTPAPGQTLTCEPGTWGGSPAFAFEWLRDGTPLGATQQTYVVTDGDRAHQLSCRVTGSNGAGSAVATSAPVSVPAPPAPAPVQTATTPAPPAPAPPTPPAPIASRQAVVVATPQETRLEAASPTVVAAALGLPSAKRCVSRRRFPIRMRQPRGVRIRSAVVSVGKRRTTARRSGSVFTAAIDLRGLPRGRFVVRITVRTASGKTLKGTRRYRTCVPKRRR